MVVYSKEFFELQLRFAGSVSSLLHKPIEDVLLEYTHLYMRLGLGRDFDPAHPLWRDYISGLSRVAEPADWTYNFYVQRTKVIPKPTGVARFGCFWYGLLPENRIRLHFENGDQEGGSSLHPARAAERRAELAALFQHALANQPADAQVIGASWLYNLEAYRRLFPAFYIETARAMAAPYQYMPLWGQFVDRRGDVKASMARPFLDKVQGLSDIERAPACFPFQALRVQAPVRDLASYY